MLKVLRRFNIIHVVTAVVLGSGLINLFSAIGPPVDPRSVLLHGIFPLDFLHLSRFFTLLSGLALIISSVNIYKRKRRAFLLVLLLSLMSIVFHLTKGLDYEEAAFSAALAILLILSRRRFTVRSSIPDLRWGIVRLTAALVAALAYGVAGFWLLDPKEFGINFTIGDSIHRTLLFLSLVGDPEVVPRTRHAHWFLYSMYLMTGSVVAYSFFAIFRPVVYRFRILPHERKLAERISETHGRSATDFFKFWPDKTFHFSASERCFIAFRVGAGCAIALGDPVGPEEEIEPTARAFTEMCDQNDWRAAFHQALPDFLPIYRRLGYRKLKIGDDAVVELARFSLEGKQAKKFRHTINLMEKEGIGFVVHSAPLSTEVLAQAREVSDSWLQIPGRRERGFSLGLFDAEYVATTPIAAAVDSKGAMLAFANTIPSFLKGEATIDLMRHRIDAPNSIMDYLLVKLLLAKKQEGFSRFNLGMAPMAGFQEREQASIEERAIHEFIQHLSFIFRFQGLRAHKGKFATVWEPRYLVYRNILNLPLLARALAEVSEIHD